jgi:hypothetical protein
MRSGCSPASPPSSGRSDPRPSSRLNAEPAGHRPVSFPAVAAHMARMEDSTGYTIIATVRPQPGRAAAPAALNSNDGARVYAVLDDARRYAETLRARDTKHFYDIAEVTLLDRDPAGTGHRVPITSPPAGPSAGYAVGAVSVQDASTRHLSGGIYRTRTRADDTARTHRAMKSRGRDRSIFDVVELTVIHPDPARC